MLPAQWCDVARDFVGRADVHQRPFEIAGVPQDDSGDEQVEAGCAIGLIFEPPVAQLAELVDEERAGECVAGLAVVESGLGASRSEEHTSELQSLRRKTYAGFCLKKK